MATCRNTNHHSFEHSMLVIKTVSNSRVMGLRHEIRCPLYVSSEFQSLGMIVLRTEQLQYMSIYSFGVRNDLRFVAASNRTAIWICPSLPITQGSKNRYIECVCDLCHSNCMQIFQINELTIFTDQQLTNNPKKQKRSKEEVGQSGTEYYDYVKWCFLHFAYSRSTKF